MRGLILLILIIGIIMLTTGYQQQLYENMTEENNKIEYRFIPQSIYDEQFGKTNLTRSFKDMFNYEDVYLGHTIY